MESTTFNQLQELKRLLCHALEFSEGSFNEFTNKQYNIERDIEDAIQLAIDEINKKILEHDTIERHKKT